MITSINKEKFEDYKSFVDKFKPKKTTDDCYTPSDVYDVVLDFVISEYGINKEDVVRPFYPGGDYENFDYSNGKIVVDNPPFSILKSIKDFYCKHNIKFFLFANHLTLFSEKDDESVCYILANSRITYENGAKINTSFVTNLDKFKIRLKPELKRRIEKVQSKSKKKPKYKYPKNIISSALLGFYIDNGIEIDFRKEDVYFLKYLESQKEYKKSIFGGGCLISDKKADELNKNINKHTIEDAIEWKLSDKEKEIIKSLGCD